TKASRDNPNDPMPHVYLSRMAREVGNMTIAGQEAQTAVRLGPENAVALRELGLYLLSAGNYDLSRRFLVRAVQIDTSDRMAQGYLGCTLIRLGRPTEAQVWFNRAGQGDWSRCAAGPSGVPGQPIVPGTQTRGVGEIAKQTKAVGAYLNAATIYDHTSYYTVLPASGFRPGLEVQADAYANSLIDSDELARELEVIIQEAKRKADNPGAV